MLLVLPAYLKRLLKNQIAIMEHLNMQNTNDYKKSKMLENAKNQNEQWESVNKDKINE